MILPIIAYGDPVLRKKGEDIPSDYPNLKELLDNMYETMYNAAGIGLAAQQINLPIRVFVIDTAAVFEKDEEADEEGLKKVFINPEIIEEKGEEWAYEEGCLSIPGIREDVFRPEKVKIKYLDENFKEHEAEYDGLTARVIQHEYDHINGVLFTDYLRPLRKRMLQNRLQSISKGIVDVKYKMKFPNKKK